MMYKGVPVLGIAAWSGTGKTTLLTQLIPILRAQGIRLAVVKHAHHSFDIDHPGKDSYKLRHCGANQTMIVSNHRQAFIKENEGVFATPSLKRTLSTLHIDELDLILVEGFKREPITKIELHRQSTNRPLLFPQDRHIVAIASDIPTDSRITIESLDINNPQQIAQFVVGRCRSEKLNAGGGSLSAWRRADTARAKRKLKLANSYLAAFQCIE